MVAVIMESTQLPPIARKGIGDGRIVRVSVEELEDVRLRPEVEAQLLQSIDDAKRGINTYGPFNTAEEMIASLQAECDKLDEE